VLSNSLRSGVLLHMLFLVEKELTARLSVCFVTCQGENIPSVPVQAIMNATRNTIRLYRKYT
jgi:hypothetical protein